jgi:hypothetical protein
MRRWFTISIERDEMLKLEGEDFTSGRARFLDRLPVDPEPTAKIFIKLRAGKLAATLLAQLDTASPWSILEAETAREIGLLDQNGEPKTLRAQGMSIRGRLVRVPVLILADEGESLEIDATVFVSADWPGKNFVGYAGLLESIRIALDPQANHFYFGAA